MSEEDYLLLVEDFLDNLSQALEDKMEQHPCIEDVTYSSGVLKLEMNNAKIYVFNKQAPNKQLWLSSPYSGPLRFEYDHPTGKWLNNRTKTNILDILNEEFSTHFDSKLNV